MPRSYRACLSSYIVLTICFGLIPTITLPMAVRGDRAAGVAAVAAIVALLLIYFWLSRFRLAISPDALVYSSLFTGERRIRLADITHTNMVYRTGLYGFRCLLAITVNGVTTRINLKVFSREAAPALFHLVGPNQSLEPTAGRRVDQCELVSLDHRTAFLWTPTTAARDRQDPWVVEIVADVNLRNHFGLQEGDVVEIGVRT